MDEDLNSKLHKKQQLTLSYLAFFDSVSKGFLYKSRKKLSYISQKIPTSD